MAEVTYNPIIERIDGALSKGGAIFRQKKIKTDDKGHFILGKKEVYMVRNPRDYNQKPATENERTYRAAFAQAARQTDQELNNPERHEYWITRFNAQLTNPEEGNNKSYVSLRSFVRTMLLKESKTGK